jgi:hypothetical protein
MSPVATVVPGRLDAARVVHSRVSSVETGGEGVEKDPMSLTEFTEWAAERGVRKSKEEWYRRVRAGSLPARKIGFQWTIALADAKTQVERETSGLKDS